MFPNCPIAQGYAHADANSTIVNLALPHTANNNMSREALLPSSSMRTLIGLLTNSMMDMFNIGQKVSIRS